MKKLMVIADWAHDAVYCREYKSAVSGFVKETEPFDISFIPVSTNSIHMGFILAQLVETENRLGRPQETIIHLANEPKNKSGDFLIIRLTSGIYVCGINFENIFSFIKKVIDEAFSYQMKKTSSSFLSRDIYSRVVAHLLESMQHELEMEEVHTNTLPEVDGHFVGHIDSFGNIITTLTHEDTKGKYRDGDKVVISIASSSRSAIYKQDPWSADEGDLALGVSSFGRSDNAYLALVIKNGLYKDSAQAQFEGIFPGVKITLS